MYRRGDACNLCGSVQPVKKGFYSGETVQHQDRRGFSAQGAKWDKARHKAYW